MHTKSALSALAVMVLGLSQIAHAADTRNDHSAALAAVMHHSVESAPQQDAAEASLQRAAHARLTTQQVIALAAQHTNGKVVQASFTMDGATPAYMVRAVSGNCVWHAYIDAENGAILDSSTAIVEPGKLTPPDKAAVKLAQQTPLSIDQAVSLAERTVGGRVLDALLEQAAGGPKYEMQVLNRNVVQNVVVDPAAGTVQRLG